MNKPISIVLLLTIVFIPLLALAEDGTITKVQATGRTPKNPVVYATVTVSGISVEGVKTFVSRSGERYTISSISGSSVKFVSPDGWTPRANPGDGVRREGDTLTAYSLPHK